MSQSLFQRKSKYRYDIALDEGVGAKLVAWVTGLMAFFATLTLALHLGLSALTDTWVQGLSGSLTVEIAPPLPKDGKVTPEQQKAFSDSVQKVLWLIEQHPAVSGGRALPRTEVEALIRPWLGEKLTKDLPLPALIDLKLSAEADVAKLQSDIRTLVPAAVIDTHTDTLDDVRTLVGTVRAFMIMLTGIIALLAIIAISGIVRSKLVIHRQEVETLHLIGASDEYIARQFRQHALKGTLQGIIGGVCATVATLALITAVMRNANPAFFPDFTLSPLHWTLLLAAPILTGTLIAHLTAQATVMRELARMP